MRRARRVAHVRGGRAFEEHQGDGRGGRAHEHAEEYPSDPAKQMPVHAAAGRLADPPDDARAQYGQADGRGDDEHRLRDVEVLVGVRVPRVVHGGRVGLQRGHGAGRCDERVAARAQPVDRVVGLLLVHRPHGLLEPAELAGLVAGAGGRVVGPGSLLGCLLLVGVGEGDALVRGDRREIRLRAAVEVRVDGVGPVGLRVGELVAADQLADPAGRDLHGIHGLRVGDLLVAEFEVALQRVEVRPAACREGERRRQREEDRGQAALAPACHPLSSFPRRTGRARS